MTCGLSFSLSADLKCMKNQFFYQQGLKAFAVTFSKLSMHRTALTEIVPLVEKKSGMPCRSLKTDVPICNRELEIT